MSKPITEALLIRIEARVDRSAGADGCHPWLGPLSRTQPILSYGRLGFYPRRVIYERTRGPVAPPARVHMRCKNTICLNVAHMMGGFEAYFHAQVDRSGGPEACWPWTGMLSKGYGRFGTRHLVRFLAHRVAYELANGPIVGHVPGHPEKEKLVMHLCDNPPCCNPRHLRIGTDAENIADMRAKGRGHGQPNQPWIYAKRRSSTESASPEKGDSHG